MPKHTKQFRAVLLFNGTGNDDKDEAVTNVVKLRDGLVEDDRQFVIYRDGIGNDQQWSSLSRYYAMATGFGGGWVMDEAYRSLKAQIDIRLQKYGMGPEDTLTISTGGFSRGAALARHFVNDYIQRRLEAEYRGRFKIKIGEEYLFDTVPSFGIPFNFTFLEWFGIRNQEINLGWDFDVPESVPAYHAIAIGDEREPFTPEHVEMRAKAERQEVYFSGDHSTVGGGHTKPEGVDKLADRLPLHYMAKVMMKNGLRFNERFVMKHRLTEGVDDLPLGHIFRTDKSKYPDTQIQDRALREKVEGRLQPANPPLLHWSVLQRLKEEPSYRPRPLQSTTRARVLHEDGSITHEHLPKPKPSNG